MEQVSDLLKVKGSQVWSIQAQAAVKEALDLLAEKNVGALLVLDKGAMAGILSERDIVRWMAKKGSLSMKTSVSELMTREVVTVSRSDSIDTCMRLITEHKIRHLPVVEGGNWSAWCPSVIR